MRDDTSTAERSPERVRFVALAAYRRFPVIYTATSSGWGVWFVAAGALIAAGAWVTYRMVTPGQSDIFGGEVGA